MSFSLNEIFTNNAVFAHSKPIKVYGKGDGEIAVTFNGQTLKTTTENGVWQVTFPKMECGGPYTLTVTDGVKTEKRTDIYVGEVILLCGQSNLQFKLHESTEANDLHPDNDKLRLFTIDRLEEGEFFKTSDGWVKCVAETVGNWSAIGYQIANEINRQKGVAVGIIACYQGASVIQSWMPKVLAERDEFLVSEDKKHGDHKEYCKWNGVGFLYEHSLSRVLPYSLSRTVYYQGESNTSPDEGEIFDKMLCAFIEHLREKLDDATLPVTVVQIADLDSKKNDKGWLAVQTAQLNVPNLTHNVNTVISADLCETNNIHPPTKKPLALRIVKSFE
ncbi:MAG: hypothetical protein J6Q76_03820 [Clostridia bacterium]|nr:hypothetical protein [Clostridia bacterium]